MATSFRRRDEPLTIEAASQPRMQVHRSSDASSLVLTTQRSRIGPCLEFGVALGLVFVALDRAWVLEHAWPVLAATSGALVLARLRVCTPARLEFVAGHCVGHDDHAHRCVDGPLTGSGRCSPLAIELCVADAERGRTRVVLWRDALTDTDFRTLSRAVRLGAAPVTPPSGAPALGGGQIQAHR